MNTDTREDYRRFPVGTRVQIQNCVEDFNFFSGTETGVVVRNSESYLGIIVKFDKPRRVHWQGSQKTFIQKEFNFRPRNLRKSQWQLEADYFTAEYGGEE